MVSHTNSIQCIQLVCMGQPMHANWIHCIEFMFRNQSMVYQLHTMYRFTSPYSDFWTSTWYIASSCCTDWLAISFQNIKCLYSLGKIPGIRALCLCRRHVGGMVWLSALHLWQCQSRTRRCVCDPMCSVYALISVFLVSVFVCVSGLCSSMCVCALCALLVCHALCLPMCFRITWTHYI